MGDRIKTDFLFTEPSFSTGVARVIDFWGLITEYNRSLTPEQADALAIYLDWRMTGQDLRDAINQFKAENEKIEASKEILQEA
ncbi:MAG: hypothetical protein HY315_10315 [Acidobacteria bacterium]|nr:hypothetical protein [Acidobacteriota bacterium]